MNFLVHLFALCEEIILSLTDENSRDSQAMKIVVIVILELFNLENKIDVRKAGKKDENTNGNSREPNATQLHR